MGCSSQFSRRLLLGLGHGAAFKASWLSRKWWNSFRGDVWCGSVKDEGNHWNPTHNFLNGWCCFMSTNKIKLFVVQLRVASACFWCQATRLYSAGGGVVAVGNVRCRWADIPAMSYTLFGSHPILVNLPVLDWCSIMFSLRIFERNLQKTFCSKFSNGSHQGKNLTINLHT